MNSTLQPEFSASERLPRARSSFFVVIGLAGCLATSAAVAQTSTTIGLSVPLSGNISKLGRAYTEGAERALRDSLIASDVKLIVVDDGCDPDLSDLASQDLVDANVSFSFGYFCNLSAEIAARKMAPNQTPLIITDARSNVILQDAKKFGWNVWRTASSENAQATKAFEVFSKRWRNIPYAVVDDGTIAGRGFADGFRSRMELAGIPPAFIDSVRAGQSTQAPLVRRLRSAGVQAVLVGAPAEDIALTSRNASELGFELEIAGGDGLEFLPFLEGADTVLPGLLGILPLPIDKKSNAKKLIEILKTEGVDLVPPYFLKGYADMQVMLQIQRDGGTPIVDRNYISIQNTVVFDADRTNRNDAYRLHRWTGVEWNLADPIKQKIEAN